MSFLISLSNQLYDFCYRPGKDKKTVRAAFEPCEAQRLALLGNKDSLYTPLHKQHRHISLLKHPALLCMVVKSPDNPTQIYTHGYICSTVEEGVSLSNNRCKSNYISFKQISFNDHLQHVCCRCSWPDKYEICWRGGCESPYELARM